MKFEKRSGDAETPAPAPEDTPSTGKKPVVIYIQATQDALVDLQDQLKDAEDTIEDLESAAADQQQALEASQREAEALLALYTLQQQYAAGDLEACQDSIQAFESAGYQEDLPQAAGDGITSPSQRYAQLKEAVEARAAEQP